jgi:hypothetical protein
MITKGGVASIVPLKLLKQIHPITYNFKRGMHLGHFIIHLTDGDIVIRNNGSGMPYLDLQELEAEVTLCLIQTMIKTIQGNFEGFTQQEIDAIYEAREAQGMLGHPTNREFLGMVCINMITGLAFTLTAVKNANTIFGPGLTGVRGQTVQNAPKPMHIKYLQILASVFDRHRIVTLAVDCMFINGVPFLVSVSRGLNLKPAEYTPTRMAKNLASGIQNIMALYKKGSFQVGTVLMDNEFKCLTNLIPIIVINTTAANEHVPEIEHRIRLIKV